MGLRRKGVLGLANEDIARSENRWTPHFLGCLGIGFYLIDKQTGMLKRFDFQLVVFRVIVHP